MDANGNGLLEPSEVSGRAERFVERLAEQAQLDRTKPLSIDALAGAADGFLRRAEGDRGNAPAPGGNNNNAPKPAIQLLVPGFGVANDGLPLPPGFGDGAKGGTLEDRYEKSVLDQADDTLRRYDRNGNKQLDQDEWKDVSWRSDPKESDTNKDGILTREELAERMALRMGRGWKTGPKAAAKPAAATTPTSATAPYGGSGGGSTREYAKSLFRRYDKNENGVLERDEWTSMSGDWSKADRNRDDKLSVEEVEAKLANYGSDGGGSSGGSRGSSNSFGGGQLRPLSPLERLPKGLPSWFARNDANADGQVAMAEYSTSWSDSQVAEFQRYDLNGDGFITPTEALQAEKESKKSSSSSLSSRDSGRYGGSRDGGPPRDGGPSGRPPEGGPFAGPGPNAPAAPPMAPMTPPAASPAAPEKSDPSPAGDDPLDAPI